MRNIALEGHAQQYGRHKQNYASNAIDGSLLSYSHSILASDPWWEVSLHKTAIVYGIKIIVIVNPGDTERFVNGVLSIRNDMENKEAICATNINIFNENPSEDTAEKTFSFITVGKIIKIQIQRNEPTYLHIKEVEIYGEYLI